MTDPYPAQNAYLRARIALVDAREGFLIGLIDSEEVISAWSKLERAGSGWDAFCTDLDKKGDRK